MEQENNQENKEEKKKISYKQLYIDEAKKYKELAINYNKLVKGYKILKNKLDSNVVTIDLNNEDNKKTISQLMAEDKIIQDKKGKEFFLAVQESPIYNKNSVVHKIYVDEIENIIIKSYYEDYDIQKPENRTLIRRTIWCKHKGYNTFSTISIDNLVKLINANKITKDIVWYSDVDCGSGNCYFTNKGNIPLNEVKKTIEKYKKNNKLKQQALFEDDSDLPEHLKVVKDTRIKEEPENVSVEDNAAEQSEKTKETISLKDENAIDKVDLDNLDLSM